MGFCWFTSTWFGKQRSQQSVTVWAEQWTSSGSWHWLERHTHSPKTFWLFNPRKALPFPQNLLALQSQKGTLLTHLYRLEDTGHKHRVKKSPLKWEMLTLEGKQGGKGRTTPCRVWVGNALSIACQHLPFPNPVGLSPASGTALSRLPLFHWDN